MLSRLMTPREQILVGSVALAIFVGAAVIARLRLTLVMVVFFGCLPTVTSVSSRPIGEITAASR